MNNFILKTYLNSILITILSFSTLTTITIAFLNTTNVSVFAQGQTFTVNSTRDLSDANPGDGICQTSTAGECTLRAAIEEANNNENAGDVDVVEFNIPTTSSGYNTSPRIHWQIRPASDLPTITESLRLLANTQPGFVDEPVILINGSNISTGKGLTIQANNSEVRSFVINNLRNMSNSQAVSIYLNNASNSVVAGNYVGLGVNGTSGTGNRNGIISLNSSNSVIGGPNLIDINVVANNYYGIYIQSIDNIVENNYVNFNKDGSNIVNNNSTAFGISGFFHNNLVVKNNLVHSRESDRIGLRSASNVEVVDNIISTNINQTVSYPARSNYIADSIEFNKIDDALIQNNIIAGYKNGASNNFESYNGISLIESSNIEIYSNKIGTNQQETLDFGFERSGIIIDSSNNVAIGGNTNNQENTISNNNERGITLNNTISNKAINISKNIFSNNLKGISLNPSLGVTPLPNDPGDGDTGANNLQNYPELFAASIRPTTTNQLNLAYSIDSDINNSAYPITVDIYIEDNNNRQGKIWIGKATYNQEQAKEAVLQTINLNQDISENTSIVTTATDNNGNTSEFSESILTSLESMNSEPNNDIIFTEINWAGSSVSDTDQWIEIYNTTNQIINLDGFTISNLGDDSNPNLVLTNQNCDNLSLNPNSYFLISKYQADNSNTMLNTTSDCSFNSLDLNPNSEILSINRAGIFYDQVNF